MEIKKILIVDDEQVIRSLFKRLLRDYEVTTVSSGEEAIEIYKKKVFDLVFIDVVFPSKMDGVETFVELKKINPDIIAVMMTGFEVHNKIGTAMEKGAFDYIYKPFSVSEVRGLFDKLKKKENLKKTDE